MASFNLYLTSVEPDIDQEICSQSIGGYCSNSVLYIETTLQSTAGLYDETLYLDTPTSGDWEDWTNCEYICVGNEIIKVSPIRSGTVSVVQRGYNGITNMHISGDVVRALCGKDLFNDVLNTDYKQYRCLALKNTSSSDDPSNDQFMYDFSIYLKQNSVRSQSSVRIALEKPRHQYLSGVSTSWNSMQIIDSSLVGLYDDNLFSESYLKIISGGGGAAGQGRIIRSFDSATGTITLYSSFSSLYDYDENVSYEIYPSPSQRIKTGTVSPETDTEYVTYFCDPRENSSLAFMENGDILSISDLMINDIVYVWIERYVEKGSEEFSMNSIVLNIKYKIRE